jgi:transposase InsO family protein
MNIIIQLEKITGYFVKFLRSDNGTEFTSTELKTFLVEKGITSQLTTTYTPELNGQNEREHRTLGEKSNVIRMEAGLPPSFWGYAVLVTNFVGNRTTKTTQRATPFELFMRRKPNAGVLKIFGCGVYLHVPKALRGKLDPKGIPAIFLGYDVNGWIFQDHSGKIVRSRDATWLENSKGIDLVQRAHSSEFIEPELEDGEESSNFLAPPAQLPAAVELGGADRVVREPRERRPVPRFINEQALVQVRVDKNDWKLNPTLFDLACEHFGFIPEIDAFATPTNSQCKRFWNRMMLSNKTGRRANCG